ncbi:MAG: MBL fold metallo-hydrolase, partial [Nocardioidaceae bacterium]|nr:MBL fold metallo-hydrolase [Nocardioidaceae bacterium]
MSWQGGTFGERARCVLAPNPNIMTLDGTNTWVLREPGAGRSVVDDPGPEIEAHLDAVASYAGQV